MWSGPGRALQFHLDLYAQVAKVARFIEDTPNGTAVRVGLVPRTLQQRLRLMTASGVASDGDSIAYRREDEREMFSPRNLERTRHVVNAEFLALNEGETHYVSLAVQETVKAAADVLEPEPLYETDMPCPSGVIVFERPLLHNDLHPDTGQPVDGLTMPIRAISWCQTGVVTPDGRQVAGITYCLYAEHESFLRYYVETYRRVVRDDPDELAELTESGRLQRAWLTDTSGWAYGVVWDDEVYGETVSWARRFLLAYWRWTWQRILVPVPHTPSRAERKLNARIRRPPLEDGHIKVLRLRREVEAERRDDYTYQGVYDHQFLVRGHWRRQWYKSLGPAVTADGKFNPESHRLVWVEPFVKGNPNGPLVLGHNVTAAVR
jgi:hypothetical protein